MSKIWFITGSSRGFGRQFAQAALERGDKVAATARNTDSLADLVAAHGEAILPLTLDVTDKAAATEAVQRAHDHFGRLDVVVNNAGYGLFGAVEELTEQQVRDQMETNFFGALWVTQAALPLLRAQGSGHIVQISTRRRRRRLPQPRRLQRLQVGPGGPDRGPRPGGRRLRHQGHPRRARRLRHRLGRLLRRLRRATARLRRAARGRRRRTGATSSPVTRPPPARPC